MKFEKGTIAGSYLITPQLFTDNRGYFFESYSQKVFADNGLGINFVQDNQSYSQDHVLRGLHLQLPPFAQAKLVRVTMGEVLDVAIDVRPKSPTYLQSMRVNLSDATQNMFYIPEGCLHGFVVTRGPAVFCYKVNALYDKNSEVGVFWRDPELGIKWPSGDFIVSAKDSQNPTYSEVKKRLEILEFHP